MRLVLKCAYIWPFNILCFRSYDTILLIPAIILKATLYILHPIDGNKYFLNTSSIITIQNIVVPLITNDLLIS